MKEPNDFSLAALLAEDGMPVSAGLTEAQRRELDRIRAAREWAERTREPRERLQRVLASIAEHEARLVELRRELEAVMRECAPNSMTDTPAA